MKPAVYILFTMFAAVGVYHMMQHLTSASRNSEDGRFFISAMGAFAWLVFCGIMASQAVS